MACSKEFKAVHHSGTRSLSALRWIVMHDEEALTARAAAAWFANPASEGSAHRCVDDKECYQTLADSYIPWAASNANTNGLHIEQAGFARWTRRNWLKRIKTINRASKIAAHWCVKYDIPPRWLSPSELSAGKRGITSHANVSEYTRRNGLPGDHSHTDPGAGWPRRKFMVMTRARVAAIKLRRRKK